jgi:hypothetical protein
LGPVDRLLNACLLSLLTLYFSSNFLDVTLTRVNFASARIYFTEARVNFAFASVDFTFALLDLILLFENVALASENILFLTFFLQFSDGSFPPPGG